MSNKKEHLGAYSFLFTTTGKFLFLYLPDEDNGKLEAVPGTDVTEFMALSPALLGVISGGVDPGEESDLRKTIMREAGEERGISPDITQITNGYPKLEVLQRRPKNGALVQVGFSVIGHKIILQPEQEQHLVDNYPHEIIAPDALADLLRLEGKTLFRPFVYVALLNTIEARLHLINQ